MFIVETAAHDLLSAEASFFGPHRVTVWYEEPGMRLSAEKGDFSNPAQVALAYYFGLSLGQTLCALGESRIASNLFERVSEVGVERVGRVADPGSARFLPPDIELVAPEAIPAGTMADGCSKYTLEITDSGMFFVDFSASDSGEYYLANGLLAVLDFFTLAGRARFAEFSLSVMFPFFAGLGWKDASTVLAIPKMASASMAQPG